MVKLRNLVRVQVLVSDTLQQRVHKKHTKLPSILYGW
ncbi:hypothetical protein E2C01_020551 [Portunus trituberculatus]|uniref:Uncharacterized protein n=1 Tax=Portunus trituberculatus TaxID=210409 RepID=A0A5B7E064_PORTR|nr:hypothetical protein [Portunus trituberculatus]